MTLLLITLADAILRLDDLFDIAQQLVIALENGERLLQISKLKICCLQLCDDPEAYRVDLDLPRLRFVACHLAT